MDNRDRDHSGGSRFVCVLLMGLFISLSLFADSRQGDILQIVRTDRTTNRGELIAVRGNSILLANEWSDGITVRLNEIQDLAIVRKAHVWTGAGLGLLGGAVLGRLFGSSGGHSWGPDIVMLKGVGIGALVGLVFGIGTSVALGSDIKLIQNGFSLFSEQELLKTLKSAARIPDAD